MDKKAFIETAKEAGRWVLLFVASWIITQTLAQTSVIPESQEVRVWLFTYSIPVRFLFNLGLTALGKLVDKYLHERETEKPKSKQNTGILGVKGLTGF